MPDDAQKIFFSYARTDADFVLKLARELRAAGADLWLDQLDIPAGRRWDRAVEEALEACPRLLVVLSPDAVDSHTVMDEVSYALEERKPVIPVLYQSCKIPFRLRRVQYVDFTGDYEAGFAQLLSDLGITPLSEAAPQATPPQQPAPAPPKRKPARKAAPSAAAPPPARTPPDKRPMRVRIIAPVPEDVHPDGPGWNLGEIITLEKAEGLQLVDRHFAARVKKRGEEAEEEPAPAVQPAGEQPPTPSPQPPIRPEVRGPTPPWQRAWTWMVAAVGLVAAVVVLVVVLLPEPPPPIQEAPPPTDSLYTNSLGMVFMRIPAGTFEMGSENGGDDEQPVHRVTISRPFYLGRYEVTQGQWKAVMGDSPSRHFTGDDALPVERVSWDAVQDFIGRLNEREECGDCYRLPTEAEWEYAARAGATGDYAGDLDAMAWYSANAGGRTHPVGQKEPNGWGLYDMHGNVWEWVSDWYGSDYYQSSPATDPQGPSTGSGRVIRGGSWYYPAGSARSANRRNDAPGYRLYNLGFRLLRAGL